jgi:hypothetical protein
VLGSDIPGHATFNPLRSDHASPGHTPVPSSPGFSAAHHHAAAAAAGGGALPFGSAGGYGDVSQTASSSEIAARHALSVTVVTAPGHDDFAPMDGGARSPGHTPLPPTASSRRASGHAAVDTAVDAVDGDDSARVRIDAPSGHDDFAPLDAGASGSPGHTPLATHTRHRSSTAASAAGSQGRRSVTLSAAPGHDSFRPMHHPDASPGATPMYGAMAAAGQEAGGGQAEDAAAPVERVRLGSGQLQQHEVRHELPWHATACPSP